MCTVFIAETARAARQVVYHFWYVPLGLCNVLYIHYSEQCIIYTNINTYMYVPQ